MCQIWSYSFLWYEVYLSIKISVSDIRTWANLICTGNRQFWESFNVDQLLERSEDPGTATGSEKR